MPAHSENIQRMRRYWDLRAFFYVLCTKIPFLSGVIKRERAGLAKLIIKNLPALEASVLVEIGCGVKPFFEDNHKFSYIGIDWSLKSLRIAQIKTQSGFYIQSECTILPIRTASTDIIIAVGLTEYIKDIDCWISEIKRVLKPSGRLVFTTSPLKMINVLRRWWNPALFIKSEEEWMNLEKKAGFKEIIQHSAGWQVQRIWKKVSPIAEITS